MFGIAPAVVVGGFTVVVGTGAVVVVGGGVVVGALVVVGAIVVVAAAGVVVVALPPQATSNNGITNNAMANNQIYFFINTFPPLTFRVINAIYQQLYHFYHYAFSR
jgi:hypothetical protein